MKSKIKRTINKAIKKSKIFIASKYFIYLTLALFIFNGIFFSIAIKEFTPSDENYHYLVIRHYAEEENRFTGPGIKNQEIATERALGDLERKPGVLYHYLMSFIYGPTQEITDDPYIQTVLLRTINVFLGLLCLILFLKIGRLVSSDNVAINLSLLFLSTTGMIVWTTAAITYDILAILFFFIFVYSMLQILVQKKYQFFMYGLAAAWATFLTKETFAPILFLTGTTVLVLAARKDTAKNIIAQLKNYFRETSYVILVPIILVLTVLTLWIAAIPVTNIVRYGTPNPSCDKVYSLQECLKNGIFKRDYNQKNAYQAQVNKGLAVPNYDPISFTGK